MYVKQRQFGIWPQAILATVQGIALGTSAALRRKSDKEVYAAGKQISLFTYQQSLTAKKKELEIQRTIASGKSGTGDLEGKKLKKLVKLGSIMAVSLAVLGVTTFYIITAGKHE